jgi:hypothetical protein
MFQIVLQFQSLEELINYAKLSDRLSNKKQKLESSSKPDNRGSKTKLIHEKAKEYHQENPNLTYRECFVLISKTPNL